MNPCSVDRIGKAKQSGWDIVLCHANDADALQMMPFKPPQKFVCLIVWEATAVSTDEISRVAEQLLNLGCVFYCCWGSDCERVHDIVDEVLMGNGSRNVAQLEVLTTWHNEPLQDAVDFFLDFACPAERYIDQCSTLMAVVIGNEYLKIQTVLAIAVNGLEPPPFPETRSAQLRPG